VCAFLSSVHVVQLLTLEGCTVQVFAGKPSGYPLKALSGDNVTAVVFGSTASTYATLVFSTDAVKESDGFTANYRCMAAKNGCLDPNAKVLLLT